MHDVLAMVRQLGVPTWFLTLSAADMQWPEIIQSIGLQYGHNFTVEDIQGMSYEEKTSWLRNNPVTVARQFHYRLDIFFEEFLCGQHNPIGEIQDYVIRIEFQARGSPHAHCIIWVKNAPKIGQSTDQEVTDFIDRHQSAAMPDDDDDDLAKLVTSLQKHRHSATCRRKNTCRFRFPHARSPMTVIARPPVLSDDEGSAAQRLKQTEDSLRQVRDILDSG